MEIEHKIKDIVYIVDTELYVPKIFNGTIDRIIIDSDNRVVYGLVDVVAIDPMDNNLNFKNDIHLPYFRVFNHLGNAIKYALTYINNQHENDISQFESQCERIKEANG